jgi:Ni/Fe-hydrogenase subunit HybB-like protein
MEVAALLGLVAVVVIVFVVGIRLGMLVAPRLDRLTEHDEEEPRDDGTG